MSTYKCKNKKCKQFNTEITESGTHLKFHVDGSITDMKAPCSECGTIREVLPEEDDDRGFCTAAFGGNGNICKK